MTNFVSLKKDLNISKSTIIKIIDRFVEEVGINDERMEQVMDANTLLHQHGDTYTLPEAEQLIGWYITSHDECVLDNEDDFSGIEVYQAEQKHQRYDNAMSIIQSF